MVQKPATLKDVAALANVSRATAARALNSYGYVGDETAQKIQAAAEKLGYRGNRLAQALRSGQLPIVGCILGDIQNPFFARIAHDIEVLAREFGHNLIIGSSEEELAQEISLLASLRSLSIRGFIVAPTSEGNNAHLQGLVDENVPLVLIDRVAEGVDCDSVVVDNEGGARKAVEYLIGMGHTRIGLLQDDMRIFTSRERRSGYRSALAAAGIAADDRMVAVSQSTVEHAVDATIRLFSQKTPPTSLFTVDSLMTQGALLAFRSMGVSIPHDVSLIGFDDFNLATFTDPQITVVSQPVSEIGRTAARVLFERLTGKDEPPRKIRFETKLIVRGSVSRRGGV
ncbi:LacI family DNA-binding transcriptional regulator [Ensifer adhaerens]|jgi:LacI family transcriptional regulator|uniref:LacI family DNA-binding transcriptional regulator n=1 Tax=Ensifer adhaerens TaxID=106592 RepID=A0ABY8HUR1_ENSAD|nr:MULTISPECIES: LacI family DNA-binding transcriptional regulator [Ensifer]KQX20400.1 LacI family transcriptional regulator [Ensifer sp. Root423]MBD9595913.1 LacI family DNA-binding transcriptional regulator [Ensifer sp. ENS05]SFH31380.1 LacI family transcriptional regulator [Ensifer sp. OV372]ANK76801.1 LacI family transcriptional regulator [Ensifer adhaerens]KDP73221.1 LacI family transcriptional regulator [Ensifer adhaerens]